jgi:prevent-host-death family protein
MAKNPHTIPVSDLEQDAAATLNRVRKSKRPLIVTRRGKATAVLLSMDVYEKNKQEREILKLLARGEREIAAGKGYNLEDVFAEADAILSKT